MPLYSARVARAPVRFQWVGIPLVLRVAFWLLVGGGAIEIIGIGALVITLVTSNVPLDQPTPVPVTGLALCIIGACCIVPSFVIAATSRVLLQLRHNRSR